MIHLGFEVGTGALVEIPARHLAVTGQTQESGKTTTLEALVARSKVSALAFVTKRGETSFAEGRRVQPYFRDRADWQFVTSIIDATLQEKNKFLRPWIMRICRETRTLADVQRKIREALRTAKGINEGVYTQLDAYLELIVPEIARARLAPNLDLALGLNVMDVSGFATPMQMLFVQSALDWVNEHEKHTVAIIPEAWEFVPEGKGSPVKASAIALVRKGAGIGNYIWVDSQDMAGVDKTILRGCAVWLIGVQREANEIKRNLSNIPASIKRPSPGDIARLEKGQFFACWGQHCVKTYVQPAWMPHAVAADVARGDRPIGTYPAPSRAHPKEISVTNEEAERLKAENAELKRQVSDLQEQVRRMAPSAVRRAAQADARQAAPATAEPAASALKAFTPAESFDNEAMYQAFVARLKDDAPGMIRLLAEKPEIEVTHQRQVIRMDTAKQPGLLAAMIAEGYFNDPVPAADVVNELKRRGRSVHHTNVYRDLNKLAEQGFLTVEDAGYQAVPGMKVNVVDTR